MKKRDWQDTVKLWATVFAAVALPLLLKCASDNHAKAIKEAELQARYVELAVQVLSDRPRDDTVVLRDWMTDILATYAPIPLPDSARVELKGGPIFQRESQILRDYFENQYIPLYCTVFARQTPILQRVRRAAAEGDEALKVQLRDLLYYGTMEMRDAEGDYVNVLRLRAGLDVDSSKIEQNVREAIEKRILPQSQR